MFTYNSIGSMSEFTMMRPVFISILIIMIFVFFTIVIPKMRGMYNNVLPILLISVMGIIVSAQTIYYDTVLVDELGLSGDAVTTIIFLFIGAFGLLNPCLYLWIKHSPKANMRTDNLV